MALRNLLRDTVRLIKSDGRHFDNIKASVQRGKIFTADSKIPIEEGDVFERDLPSGITEKYRVTDAGFNEHHGGIPAHYQSHVEKVTSFDTSHSIHPMMTKMTVIKKVFISYVRENTDEVDRICKKLSDEGISYWIDREDIEPGKLWKTAIKDAINNGAYFLACFSREYAEKSETHMNEEILVAIEILRKKSFNSGWFIPIKLSECEIPAIDIGAGHTLQDIHHLKFYQDWDTEMKRLIDVIKREETQKVSEKNTAYFEKELTYQGLKSLIESGSGAGFHNADLGHPVYRLGASAASIEIVKDWEYADSPDKNLLYKMLSRLSKELKKSGIEDLHFIWWYDFSEWRDFCKFAIDTYDRKKGLEI